MTQKDRIIKMVNNHHNKKVTFVIYREIIYIPNFKYHKFAPLLWWSTEEISIMVMKCKQELFKIQQSLPYIDTKSAIKILCEQY